MAEIRSLKLALLADTKQFIEGLDKADKETRSFSDKLGSALKKNETLAIQTTTATNLNARVKKISNHENVGAVREGSSNGN